MSCLTLKIAKVFQSVEYSFTVPKNQSWTELAHRGTVLDFLTSIVAKHLKIEGGHFGENLF